MLASAASAPLPSSPAATLPGVLAGFSRLRRANVDGGSFADALSRQGERSAEPMSPSSAAEDDLSRDGLDRRRSKIGPAAVHITGAAGLDEVGLAFDADLPAIDFALLRRRLGRDYVKRAARDVDVPVGTAKKWFLGQNGPSYPRLVKLHRLYGALLAERAA